MGSCAPFCGERNMMKQRKIELLAPAKNLECGIEAVNHGADAVYIGAPKFGARAAAVNSLEDIAALVAYAHLYNVRIYVTVNTILKEEELAETEKMIWELYRIGVDALIVQDMGITRLNLPPIPLHGSTQMDNRTPEKVRFLADAGFRQVVLARELSLQEIRRIHEACPETPLEVFVHGALCVSYSGQCYVSQACFGRVCPVLPPAVQPGRCRRENNRPRQAPALLERPEPKRSAGRPAGCRRLFPQDRRAVEGRFLCEERYGCLSQQAGCHLRPSQGVRTCFFGYLPFRLHAPVGQEFQPWLHITSCRVATGKSPLSIRRSPWARRWVR